MESVADFTYRVDTGFRFELGRHPTYSLTGSHTLKSRVKCVQCAQATTPSHHHHT